MNSTTGAEYRHQTKLRVQKFRQEQERRGYKSISVFISEDFRAELDRLNTDQGFNRQDAMDYIFNVYQESVTSNATITEANKLDIPMDKGSIETGQKKPEFLTAVKEELSTLDPGNISIDDRDRLVLKLYEAYPGKGQAQERIDLLNDADILFERATLDNKTIFGSIEFGKAAEELPAEIKRTSVRQ